MYISYTTSKGIEYAKVTESVRKGNKVTKGKSLNLGRVLDKSRGIYQNRERGVFCYDLKTNTFSPPPVDFVADTARKNSTEKLIVDFGDAFLVNEYIRKIGLDPVLEALGDGNTDSFRALLTYTILEQTADRHCADWFEGNYCRILFPKANLSAQHIRQMLESIGEGCVYRKFFRAYIDLLNKGQNLEKHPSILIDGTGVPSNARLPVTPVSDHEGNISNEVRLIYVVQQGTGLPIYLRYVPNISDISTLPITIEALKADHVDTQLAVLDADYLTQETMVALFREKISFLTRLKKSWNLYGEIIKDHLPGLECEANRTNYNGRFVYLKRIERIIQDGDESHTLYCYLGIDDARRAMGNMALSKRTLEEDISEKTITKKLQSNGVSILISSRKIATRELLALYETRQDIEQVFDISKNYGKALPLCVESEGTFRGHLLLTLIATIVRRKLQQELVKTPYSLDDLIVIMRNHKAKVYDDFTLPMQPTKKQNDLYRLLQVTPSLVHTKKKA